MTRVVVTGIGFISPIGSDEKTLTKNLRDGFCGLSPISSYEDPNLEIKFAGQCLDFNEKDYFSIKEAKRMDRVNQLGLVAARKAVKDSNIDLSTLEEDRVGISIATGIGGIETFERECEKAVLKDFSKVSPFFIPMVISNMTSAYVAIDLNIHGNVTCPVTACASSNSAILDGYRSIKDGYNDLVLCGGAEASITRIGMGGFSSMKALSKSKDINRASIPFDLERSGFVMGEGAGVLVLENYDYAKKRNAKIYGEIIGGYFTNDANHITAPEPSGKYAAMAMEKTILGSGYTLDQVDYINAHGTSTPMNDKTETQAIKKAFGDLAKSISISSTKSMTGHLLGASGAIEAIITLMAIKNSFIPPTINYEKEDPECDLDITPNKAKNKKIRIALSNSLGFGGHNVTIGMKGLED